VPVTGNATIALFAAVMADCGLLTTVCVIGGTFRTPLESRGDRQGRRLVQLAVAQPNVLVGVIIGAPLVFLWGTDAIETGAADAVTAPLGLLLIHGALQ
jgi:Na+/H+-translocating membrane pyrophosphatase